MTSTKTAGPAIACNGSSMRAVCTAAVAGLAVAALLVAAQDAAANTAQRSDASAGYAKTAAKRAGGVKRVQAPGARMVSRANAPVVIVPGTGPGQAGYIHYFVITDAAGERESQIGIELPGGMIAWSVPETGVITSAFIKSGSMTTARGSVYEVEHLYGIKPFPDDVSMRSLQKDLVARVKPWLDDKTPYCDEERPPDRACVSCLGFVLRVVYPGGGPVLPALPADFKSARRTAYTTEDYLLYLAGVSIDAAAPARRKRIAALDVPDNLREELTRISEETDAIRAAQVAKAPEKNTVNLPKRALSRRRS